ncbi:MAG: DNA primase [Oscillospiraceae bacterium]|jgi:DNA primase|nr:DNA primase [Oscillospiraceae bacterium]MCI8714761.1 DNA primase [Oscillospiraceae bacterium]
MAFPQQFLDELASRNDIVDVVSSYVALAKKGGNYFGLCPFHNEKTGSFSVSPDKQMYYCFGCRHGGGVVNFIMEIENLAFPDAVRFLAKRVNLDVPEDSASREESRRRQRVLALNKDAARWFYQNLSRPEGAAVGAYLAGRRISRKTAMNFGLGASLDSWDALLTAMQEKGYTKAELLAAGLVVRNKQGRLYDKFRSRLMFPVIDVRGDVVAFGGRVLDKSEPKYMNTTETIVYSKRRNLYGINLAKRTKRPNFILCEGNIDVITLHQAGFDNAVASMGTALTLEQTKILSRYTKELVLCYDNDAAGQMATQKNIDLLKDSDFSVRVLQLPRRLVDGEYVKQDVDDFIKLQGAAAFEAVLSGSENQMDYRMEAVAARYDLSDGEQKIAYAGEISQLIASVSSAVEREVYAGRAAERAGISREAMLLEVKRAFGKKRGQERRALQRENLNAGALRQPKDRTIRYTDMRSAMAEQGLIQLLLTDASLADGCRELAAEDFSAPFLGRIYQRLLEARAQRQALSLTALAGECTPEEMGHLTSVMHEPVDMGRADRALRDYIRVIKESADKRRGGDPTVDPLLAAKDKFKEKKGYGGKQND